VISTKERVARATREILEAEGAAAVSMRRVAAAVGITPMALYRHYPSREALLGEVCDAAFDEVAGAWRVSPRRHNPEDDLLAAADAMIDFALARPRLYSYRFTERRDRARRFPDDFIDGQSPTLNVVVADLEDGMSRGVFRRDDPWATAFTVAAQLHGLIALYLGGRIAMAEPAFRDLCHDCLRRLLHGIRS